MLAACLQCYMLFILTKLTIAAFIVSYRQWSTQSPGNFLFLQHCMKSSLISLSRYIRHNWMLFCCCECTPLAIHTNKTNARNVNLVISLHIDRRRRWINLQHLFDVNGKKITTQNVMYSFRTTPVSHVHVSHVNVLSAGLDYLEVHKHFHCHNKRKGSICIICMCIRYYVRI